MIHSFQVDGRVAAHLADAGQSLDKNSPRLNPADKETHHPISILPEKNWKSSPDFNLDLFFKYSVLPAFCQFLLSSFKIFLNKIINESRKFFWLFQKGEIDCVRYDLFLKRRRKRASKALYLP